MGVVQTLPSVPQQWKKKVERGGSCHDGGQPLSVFFESFNRPIRLRGPQFGELYGNPSHISFRGDRTNFADGV